MMHRLAWILLWSVAGTATARAQVLVTGETGGSGAQAVVVTANLVTPKDFSTLANYWAEYAYGLGDRVDVFAAYGNISVFDHTQHYVGVGSNVSLLRRGRFGLDVAFFNNVSVPVTRQDESCTALLTLAFVASRPVKLGALVVTPYGGVDALVPVGHRSRGVFTPVTTLRAGVVGAAIPLSKAWAVFAEYNGGPHLKSGGVGVAVTLPHAP